MNIRFVRHQLGLRRPIASASGGNKAWQQRLYVRLETDDGTVGFGEAAPHPTRGPTLDELETEARDWLAANAPSDPHDWRHMPPCLQLAAIDALARRQGVPAWQFLGLPRPPAQSRSVLTFGGTALQVCRQVTEERPAAVKLKMVGDEDDWRRLDALRQVYSGPMVLDVNGAWATWDHAARNLERLARLDRVARRESRAAEIVWVEQPCPAEAMQSRLPTKFPIYADEAVMHPAFRWDCYDGIVIKPAASAPANTPRIRGLAKCIEVAREATAMGVLVTLGCHLQSSLLTTASLHLSGLATAPWLDLDSAALVEHDPFTPGCINGTTGLLRVGDVTGFGKLPLGIF